MEETNLIQQLQIDFSDELFEALISPHLQYGFAIIYRLTLHKEDSEDILQEALVKVIQGLPRFKMQSSFRTWFSRICYNEGLTFLGKQRKLDILDFDSIEEVLSADSDVEEEIRVSLEREKLWKIVDTLNPQYRLVLLLFYQEDLKIRDIADQLGSSEEAIKVTLYRARQQLKERIISS